MKNGIKFNVCGLNFKYFVPFFAVVMLCTYLGILPTAKVYSNDAGTYVATTFVATVAFLMCIGGLFFWLGNTIPIVNNYLGGACLLPLFGASLMNYLGLIPENLQNGCKVLMKTGFQDAYIALLLVGSVLVMDRKVLLNATARYLPTVIGSQVFALLFCVVGGLITGFGVKEALFNVGAPCMSGGSAGAMTTLPSLYSTLTGEDMTGLAGQFLCYASIANVLAVLFAAIGGIQYGHPGKKPPMWLNSIMNAEMEFFSGVMHGDPIPDEFKPLMTGEAARAAIATADAATLSLRENRKVSVEEVMK